MASMPVSAMVTYSSFPTASPNTPGAFFNPRLMAWFLPTTITHNHHGVPSCEFWLAYASSSCSWPLVAVVQENYRPRGRVLKGGQPFVVPEGEYVRLIFVPVVESGNPHETYVAEYNRQNGSFKVAGKDLQGMPPGKYKIAVEHLRKRADLLKVLWTEIGPRLPAKSITPAMK